MEPKHESLNRGAAVPDFNYASACNTINEASDWLVWCITEQKIRKAAHVVTGNGDDWPGLCQTGQQQSPIDLPEKYSAHSTSIS